MYGLEFNGKHSYDYFGITMGIDRNIGFPEKEKLKDKVPFSNVEYDFSEIYGDQAYTTRELKYTFNILDKGVLNDTHRINVLITAFSNWLMNTRGKQKLIDDTIPGYYFMAEVEGGLDFDELWNHGTLTVIFTAYPFKISEEAEGDDIWDTFNFLLDYAQITDFEVNGTKEVTLYNPGTPNVNPKITSSSAMEIKLDGITYNLNAGTTESDDFVLKSGKNNLTITGNGSISFKFYKELI